MLSTIHKSMIHKAMIYKAAACLAVTLLSSLFSLSVAHAQTSATWTFDGVPSTSSPLTLTQNGISATFTIPYEGPFTSDDGAFRVGAAPPVYSSAFSGNVLSSALGYAGDHQPLLIQFSQSLTSLSLDYGTTDNPAAPGSVLFSAFSGSKTVGTQTLIPSVMNFSPEGTLSYQNTGGFNSVELAPASSLFLTVDNVQVVTAPKLSAVPEASPLLALGIGALGLSGLAWRARRRRCA